MCCKYDFLHLSSVKPRPKKKKKIAFDGHCTEMKLISGCNMASYQIMRICNTNHPHKLQIICSQSCHSHETLYRPDFPTMVSTTRAIALTYCVLKYHDLGIWWTWMSNPDARQALWAFLRSRSECVYQVFFSFGNPALLNLTWWHSGWKTLNACKVIKFWMQQFWILQQLKNNESDPTTFIIMIWFPYEQLVCLVRSEIQWECKSRKSKMKDLCRKLIHDEGLR